MKTLKRILILTLLAIPFISLAHPNKERTIEYNNENKSIEKAVKTYVKGGDEQSVSLLETIMHDNYRVIINDTKENTIKELDKSAYLDFIGKKVFGGEPRKIEIEDIEISKGLNATVKLKMHSTKATFHSQFSLVKVNGKWWIVQDLAYMELK